MNEDKDWDQAAENFEELVTAVLTAVYNCPERTPALYTNFQNPQDFCLVERTAPACFSLVGGDEFQHLVTLHSSYDDLEERVRAAISESAGGREIDPCLPIFDYV
ncbi:MAG: hypothetical protein B7X31_01925 [Thiomonas sp. 13-66-29]|jgi:hypothetical protein|nr:MAG: hypothetical protein B7X31_01925 [Thiomonas sp. 13-66-29]